MINVCVKLAKGKKVNEVDNNKKNGIQLKESLQITTLVLHYLAEL